MNACMNDEHLPGICMILVHEPRVHDLSDSFVSRDQTFSSEALSYYPHVTIGNSILALTGAPIPCPGMT